MGTGDLSIAGSAHDGADGSSGFADSEARFSITDLSREFAVTPRTLRFYEDEGLLTQVVDEIVAAVARAA
mgnify:CR=1 FL=1